MTDSLRHVAARAALGLASITELITAATTSLREGCDSNAFKELVSSYDGHQTLDESQALNLFWIGLTDMGLRVPAKDEAVLTLSREVAWRIVQGNVSPLVGAEEVRLLNLHAQSHIAALDAFRHASFEANPYEQDLELKRYYEDMVLEAARSLIGIKGQSS